MTNQTSDDDLKKAFLAGFKSSAEGFNGEYPCEAEPDDKIFKDIEHSFNDFKVELEKNR